MIRALFILAILCCTGLANGQTIITGTVSGKDDGKGLPGISVSIKDKKSAVLLHYAITDDKGFYRLKFSSTADSLLVTVSGFNIARQLRSLANRTQEQNFEISHEAIKLKEIKVNPPKIRKLNDTINYLVNGFLDKNDRTIGDVLKKMPGIEVKTDGSILYNNKPINKFYIEDRDLLQGRYGIATNNIEAKDVSTVQVLENHHPVKALKNREFSDDAALNIKLKDSAKGVLVANAKAGAGLSPLLWNNELFSMYFNKGRQNMNTYKGNNSGDDPGSDLTSFYSDANKSSSGTSLAVQSPANPGISQKRYLFNRAHAFTVNNMWTAGKDNQINANISYLDDRQDKSSFSRSVYYLPSDSLLTIEERLTSRESVHQLDASFQLNKNKEKYYLDNVLNFKGKWNELTGMVMSGDTIFQRLQNPSYTLNNVLTLVRNYKKASVRIYSYNGYSRIPQHLAIQPVLYPDLFNTVSDPLSMQQVLTQNQFSSVNRLSFGFTEGIWKQNYTLGFNASLRRFESDLQQQTLSGNTGITPDSLRNNFQFDKYELFVSPDYTYAKNQIKVTLNAPLSYNSLQTKDQLSGIQKSINRLFFKPSLSVSYDFNLFLALVARAAYDNQLGDISNVFTGYIMQSYRNLLRNDGQLPEQRSQSYSLNLNYRHPLHAIFINIGSSYSRNRSNLLYGYAYQGILSLKQTYTIPNVTDNFSVFGRLSKGIDAIGGTFTLDASFNSSNNTTISQERLIDFKNENYLLKPGINAKIKAWASFAYSFQFGTSKNRVRNDISNFAPIRSNTQRTQLNFYPAEGVTVNLAHEYFYSSAIAAGNRTMNFVDTGIKYKHKNMEYTIGYDNIFNVKQYISASYNSTNTYYSAYNLRPAQLLLSVRFKVK